jgi:outer membrane protein OmpA-like peptidoglycan-associated protein
VLGAKGGLFLVRIRGDTMERLNKLGLLCVIMVLLVAGCGKKKGSTDAGSDKSSSKKLASADNIPLLKEETENLLEDTDIADFAFVDDEANKSAEGAKVAENEAIEFADETSGDDNSASFAFKAVHFDFNKNSIRPDQKPVVDEDLKVAKQAVETGHGVVVEGHCDQLGSASYNIALSQRRAEAIKQEFVKNGIDNNQVKTVGYGFERPVVWSDAQDRGALIKELAANRRAEVVVN